MSKGWAVVGLALAALIQTGIIGWIIADRAMQLQSGREVLLETRPIDPRDLFRGHYVRLNLAMTRLERDAVTFDPDISYNDAVFVELTEGDDGFFLPVHIHQSRPDSAAGPVIAAKARFRATGSGEIRLSVPITRYYAPKARALELEGLNREARVGVLLSVSDAGTAVIAGLTVDGEKVYEEPLF